MRQSDRVQPATLSRPGRPVTEVSEDGIRSESLQQSTIRLSPVEGDKSQLTEGESAHAQEEGPVNAEGSYPLTPSDEPRSPPLDAYQTVPISFKNKPKPSSKAILPPISPSSLPFKQHNRRRSSLNSEDPLMSVASRKKDGLGAADFVIFGSFGSDRGRSTLASKQTEGMKGLESIATGGEEMLTAHESRPCSLYSPGRVEDSTRARSQLLCTGKCLEGKHVIVEMATSVPIEYPALDLSEKGLEDSDLIQVGRLLDVYPFATSLDLFGNKFQFSSPEHRAAHNPHPSLSSLSLSRNPLGPLPSHTTLTRFLASFPSLLSLDLADCELTDDDLLRIGADIAALAKLQRLNLRGNPITVLSQPTIVRIVSSSQSIEIIDLRMTRLSRKIWKNVPVVGNKLLLDEGKRCCRGCILQ